MLKTTCHSHGLGKERGSINGRPVTNLDEIPPLMEAALDLFAVEELREAAFHVIHQAAGVRQKSRGPEGAEMKEPLLGVACKLGAGTERKKTISIFGVSLKSDAGEDNQGEPQEKTVRMVNRERTKKRGKRICLFPAFFS